MNPTRLCACGCGRPIPPDAPARRAWFDQACRQRGYRMAERRRRAARAASVAAAVAGQGDLGELLQEAARAARARPGSVLLRVAGRLVPLDEHQLVQLAEGLRQPRTAEVPAVASVQQDAGPALQAQVDPSAAQLAPRSR